MVHSHINSVSLSEPLDDVMMVASWYEPIDAARAVYRLNIVNDTCKYPLGSAYLGCPRLDHDADACICKLVDAPRQIRALDNSLAATSRCARGRGAQSARRARSTLAATRRRARSGGLGCSAGCGAQS